jgi:hypothetical protein
MSMSANKIVCQYWCSKLQNVKEHHTSSSRPMVFGSLLPMALILKSCATAASTPKAVSPIS